MSTITITRPEPAATQASSSIELSSLPEDSSRSFGPGRKLSSLEAPRDPGIEPLPGTEVFTPPSARSLKAPLFAANFAIFLAGVNDAALGPLIPYLQPSYKIGLTFVAIVYICNFCGWVLAAFTNAHLTARFGVGGAITFGAIVQTIGHALQFWKPPYPLFAVSFFLVGWGIGYQDAQANAFVGGIQDSHRWLGLLHSIYGVGALITPLIATNIASRTDHWERFYYFPFGLAVINVALLAWSFRGMIYSKTETSKGAKQDLKRVLGRKEVWLIALFFFCYVGTEVTAGGWVVEFLIRVRKGTPSKVGYVASGFWGGLTLGRIVLAEPTHRFGDRRMIFLYLLLAIGAQLIFWFVPNLITSAVMISILGFLIGPFYPTGVLVATKLLPRELHVAAIGFMASTGQAGSAAFPFLTGAVAAKEGVRVLQPILVGLLAALIILWKLIPKVEKRTE